MRSFRLRQESGFSLPEISIVMFLSLLASAILILFYSKSRLLLERGVAKTELQQRTRLAATRIIPKLTSVVRRPATSKDPLIPPVISPAPSVNPELDPGESEIVLNTTSVFVKEQLRQPITAADEFNPREIDTQFAALRLWFEPSGPSLRDARIGNVGRVMMDGNTPGNASDDVEIARELTHVSWMVYPDNRKIRLRILAKGLLPNAIGGKSVDTLVYETDIFLPVYTNSEGGSSDSESGSGNWTSG